MLFVFVGLQSSAARMFPWHVVTHPPRYNRARDCRGGHIFSTQIRSGFTKRQSCSICLALREEYSDVPDELLEIPLEVVDRLDREDVDEQGAGPSSSSHPFKKKNCAICVEDTRKLIMPLQTKQQ